MLTNDTSVLCPQRKYFNRIKRKYLGRQRIEQREETAISRTKIHKTAPLV